MICFDLSNLEIKYTYLGQMCIGFEELLKLSLHAHSDQAPSQH
jgi:hypothetical protein